jgi:hypothetical protein
MRTSISELINSVNLNNQWKGECLTPEIIVIDVYDDPSCEDDEEEGYVYGAEYYAHLFNGNLVYLGSRSGDSKPGVIDFTSYLSGYSINIDGESVRSYRSGDGITIYYVPGFDFKVYFNGSRLEGHLEVHKPRNPKPLDITEFNKLSNIQKVRFLDRNLDWRSLVLSNLDKLGDPYQSDGFSIVNSGIKSSDLNPNRSELLNIIRVNSTNESIKMITLNVSIIGCPYYVDFYMPN